MPAMRPAEAGHPGEWAAGRLQPQEGKAPSLGPHQVPSHAALSTAPAAFPEAAGRPSTEHPGELSIGTQATCTAQLPAEEAEWPRETPPFRHRRVPGRDWKPPETS